ncbi:MAG: PAS domain S-box protein [Nitrospiraceae bacterium]|nr:MAG: PAS domain S-box protein [Nitrospiraceae bacterium]
MAKTPDESQKLTGLRNTAEELLRAANRDIAAMPVKDVQQLVAELQVHRVELEMQNEELRRAHIELEEARDRYADLYDSSPTGHLSLDTHGMIVEANLRAATLLGLNRKELIGQTLASFIASDDQDIFHRHCQDVVRTGARQACEVHLRKKAGACCCVYLESLAFSEDAWCSIHWRAALLDISDRKRAEQELAIQQAQLEGIIASAMDAIITIDEGERVVVFNRAAESMFLCQAADVIGQPLDQFIPERFRQAHQGHLRGFALTHTTSRSMGQSGALFGLRANGEEFPIEASISHVRVDGKNLMTVILRDVTERKRAEHEQARLIEDLTRSQQHFQSLFNWTPSAVGISTLAEGRFIDVNEGFIRLTGYRREEVIGRTILEVGLWADPSQRAIVLREIREQGFVHNREGFLRTKSGGIRSVMVSVESIQLGSTPCLIYLAHDITERKRAEEALRLAKFSIDRAADAIYWIDPQAKILDVNEAASLMLGYSRDELCAMTVHDLNPDFQADMWPGFWAETQRRGTMVIETAHRAKSGRLNPVEVSINYLSHEGKEYHCAFVRDITARKQAEAELSESEARLRAILDHSPGMVFLKDPEGRYLHVNHQFERAFHVTRDQVVGNTDEAIFAPDQAAAFRANDLKVFEAGIPFEFEEVTMHDDGPHTSIVSKFPLRDGNGTQYALCGITTDITWRKAVEETLRASDAFTRTILNSLSAHVCVLDREGMIVSTNDAWKEFARCNSNRAVSSIEVGQNYLDVCRQAIAGGQSTVQITLEGIEAVLAGSEPSFTQEYACHSPDEQRWFLMRVRPLKEAKGVVISHTDISQRVQMGQALEQHVHLLDDKQKELESLARKLIEAQEAERKRIARELHDDFNQRLAALSVELESMERAPIALPEPMVQQLSGIRVQVGQLSDDLHDLAYKLHPSLLEHVGLEVAARDHVAEFAKRTGLAVTYTAREVPKVLSSEVATNLFRVLQESLQNVAKHAQATEVTVRLSGSSKGAGVSVRDNGKGFDVENKQARVKGLGLVSMQERTRGLGGFLRIHSFARDGTKVCAWIPRFQESA